MAWSREWTREWSMEWSREWSRESSGVESNPALISCLRSSSSDVSRLTKVVVETRVTIPNWS